MVGREICALRRSPDLGRSLVGDMKRKLMQFMQGRYGLFLFQGVFEKSCEALCGKPALSCADRGHKKKVFFFQKDNGAAKNAPYLPLSGM